MLKALWGDGCQYFILDLTDQNEVSFCTILLPDFFCLSIDGAFIGSNS